MKKADSQRIILKLMVIALNEVVRKGIINLNDVSVDTADKHKRVTMLIAGKPTILNWFDAGYDELRVSVWWDYQPELMPTWRKKHLSEPVSATPSVNRKYFRHILGLCGSCYLERRTGKFIIGEEGSQFFSTYVREESVYALEQIRHESPAGYDTHGRVPA